MKSYQIVSGQVSHAQTISTTESGWMPVGQWTYVSTTHTTHSRLNGKPVRFQGPLNMGDGDFVTAVGFQGLEFEAFALRNGTTGIGSYRPSPGFRLGKIGIFGGGIGLLASLSMSPSNNLLTRLLAIAAVTVMGLGIRAVLRDRALEAEVVAQLESSEFISRP